MNPAIEFLLEHWLALAVLVAALGFGVATAVRRLRSGDWAWRYHLPAAILASYAGGAFAVHAVEGFPWWLGPTVCLSAFGIFVGLLVLVILTGHWSAAAGYGLTCAFFLGL